MNPQMRFPFKCFPGPVRRQIFQSQSVGLGAFLFLGLAACESAPKPSRLDAQRPGVGAAAPASAAPKPEVAAASQASTNPPVQPVILFDGTSLKGWKPTDFAGAGAVKVEKAFHGEAPAIVLEQGIMTGITWTNSVPTENFEIRLEAMRVSGGDFFCGLTFPVGKDPCSLIVGGWGGGVVGLSSVDSEDAAHNETTRYMKFETGRWYRVRVRVVPERIQAWIDDERVVDLPREDHQFSIRLEVEMSKPLGIATWSTSGAVRNLHLGPAAKP